MRTKHYKSWSGLNKQLQDCLCKALKERVTYFLTRYHEVHNAYGRATIRVDGRELVNFSWTEMYQKDADYYESWKKTGEWGDTPELIEKWNQEGIVSDWDFLEAATEFLQMNIRDALESENYLIRVFAIMDRRVGERTLARYRKSKEYMTYPQWVRQFYELRLTLH